MASHRIQQVNELIRHELSQLLMAEDIFPADNLVTINSVTTSKDLGQARILISIMPAEQQGTILEKIRKQAKHLQHLLGEKLVIRKVPKLLFAIDPSVAQSSHIDSLIDKIHKEG